MVRSGERVGCIECVGVEMRRGVGSRKAKRRKSCATCGCGGLVGENEQATHIDPGHSDPV